MTLARGQPNLGAGLRGRRDLRLLTASSLPATAHAEHGGGYRGGGWGGGYYGAPGLVFGSPYYCNPPLIFGGGYPERYGHSGYCN